MERNIVSFDFIFSDQYTHPIIKKRSDSSKFFFRILSKDIRQSSFRVMIFEQIRIISREKVARILSRLPLEQIDERFDNWRRETASTDVIGHRVKVS